MEKNDKSPDIPAETAVFIRSDSNLPKALESGELIEKDDWEEEEEESEREHWSRSLDFVLSLVGYAVGVSNLWRFPYLTLKNGGGAFLIPFFFFLTMCGIPLFYLEVCLGQFSGTSSLFVWKLCPLFKGIGYGMVIVSGMACIYYNAVLSWVLYYLVNSFYPVLPWTSCQNWWNTNYCITQTYNTRQLQNISLSHNHSTLQLREYNSSYYDQNKTAVSLCTGNSSLCLGGSSEIKLTTAAEEFWQYNVLRKSDGLHNLGNVQMHIALCLLASWFIVCLCLFRGVKSLGKVVYFTALAPYVLLTIFLVRGCMLPGAIDGIIFYVKPDFDKLMTFNVWIEACLQVFYSLGPAWGGLITMASYNKFNNHCFRDVLIASFADGLTSIYGGFVIFSVLGFMAKEANVSITDVATQGPGLALVAYPEAISKFPVPHLWAVLFFSMLLLLGIDSQFGTFETVIDGFVDAFPTYLRKRRVLVTFGLASISYLVSLPIATNGGIYVFTLLDWYVAAFCVMITSLIECFIIGWIYGVDRFCDDIELMLGKQPGIFIRICWTVITPLVLLFAFISTCAKYTLPVYGGYVFPNWANAIGFIIAIFPLIPIPVWMVIVLYKEKGTLMQRLRSSLRPADNWGPAHKRYKTMYVEKQKEYSQRPHWFVTICRRDKV